MRKDSLKNEVEVELGPKADKFLDKLPKDVALRIINKLKQLKENLFKYLEHYSEDNTYKFRVGNYRALIDANFKEKKLVVRIIDKRSRIYKR